MNIQHFLHKYESEEQLDDCGYKSYCINFYPAKDGNQYNPFSIEDDENIWNLFSESIEQLLAKDNMKQYLEESYDLEWIPIKNKHSFFISCSLQISFFVNRNDDDVDPIIDSDFQIFGNFMNLTFSFMPIVEHFYWKKCFCIHPKTFAQKFHQELQTFIRQKQNAYKVIIDTDTIKLNKINYFATFSKNAKPLIEQLYAYTWYKMIQKDCKEDICLFEAYYYHYLEKDYIDEYGGHKPYLNKPDKLFKKAFDDQAVEFQIICRSGNIRDFFYYVKEVLQKQILIYICNGCQYLGDIHCPKVICIRNQHAFIPKMKKFKKLQLQTQNLGYQMDYQQFVLQNEKESIKNNEVVWFFDLESFEKITKKGQKRQVPYCICFKTNNYMGEKRTKVKKFYGSKVCLDQFVNYCLKINKKDKKRKQIAYAHNGGRYDWIFLPKRLINKCEIFIAGTSTNIKGLSFLCWKFYDFRNIWAGKLDSIAKLLNIPLSKGKIDFSLITEENHMEQRIMDLVIPYNELDVDVLAQVYEKYVNLFGEYAETLKYVKYNCITSAALGFQIMRDNFLKIQIFGLPSKETNEKFRDAFQGGKTEVLIQEAEDVESFDLNSAYGWAMTQILPYIDIPGFVDYVILKIIYVREVDELNSPFNDISIYEVESFELDAWFLTIGQKDNRKLLWYTKENNKEFGNKWIWGKELNNFIRRNQVVAIVTLSHVNFKGAAYLKEFVEFFMKIKNEAPEDRPDRRAWAKLMVNSCYGRFGIHHFPKQLLLNSNTFKELQIHDNFYEILKGVETQGYDKEDEDDETTPNKLIVTKMIPDLNEQSSGQCHYISSFIAMSIRCLLADTVYQFPQACIAYVDTDCFHLVMRRNDKQFMAIYNRFIQLCCDDLKLGYWKKEKEIKHAIYILAKVYYCEFYKKGKDGKIEVAHMKGIQTDQLTKQDFVRLLNGESVNFINKNIFHRKNGNVDLSDDIKKIQMNQPRRKFISKQESYPYDRIPIEYIFPKKKLKIMNNNQS